MIVAMTVGIGTAETDVIVIATATVTAVEGVIVIATTINFVVAHQG